MKPKYVHKTGSNVILYAYDDYSVEWFEFYGHCRASELPNGAHGPNHQLRIMNKPMPNTNYVDVNDSFHKAWLPCWWVRA